VGHVILLYIIRVYSLLPNLASASFSLLWRVGWEEVGAVADQGGCVVLVKRLEQSDRGGVGC
jgi:hypothetical protein